MDFHIVGMLFGGLISVVGLVLLVCQQAVPGQGEFELFGMKAKLSTPTSFLVFFVGVAVFALFLILRLEHRDLPQSEPATPSDPAPKIQPAEVAPANDHAKAENAVKQVQAKAAEKGPEAVEPPSSIKPAPPTPDRPKDAAAPLEPPTTQRGADRWPYNVTVYFYAKGSDRATIERALRNAGIPYILRPAELQGQLRTNAIACHPSTPPEALRRLIQALQSAGVDLQFIYQFRNPSEKPGRIEVLSYAHGNADGTSTMPDNPVLTNRQLASVSNCPTELGN